MIQDTAIMSIQSVDLFDALYYLSKHFLDYKDNLALALSGGHRRFSETYFLKRLLIF